MGFFSSIKNFFGKSSDKNQKDKATSSSVTEEKASANDALETASTTTAENKTAVQANEQVPNFSPSSAAASQQLEAELTPSPQAQQLLPDKPGAEIESLKQGDIENGEKSAVKEEKIDRAAANEAEKTQISGLKEGNDELLVKLRQADPRLSVWLDLVLENVETADDLFWNRLTFLLHALEAPEAEIAGFTADFKKWLEKMEYWHLDEFRSELQYRLALALDLEDEEDERNRLLLKLRNGLAKTRESLGRQLDHIFASKGELDDKFWEELEELFIMSDMGYDVSLEMVNRLKKRARKDRVKERSAIKDLLFQEMSEILNTVRKIQGVNKPEVILMSGVNGAGKTTTIAKLANRMRMQGKKVLVVAADTFRAAAIEQLQVWAERAGALFYAKSHGADPASVAWEGLDFALRENVDVVFIDTAGRLQNKTNLMEELGKIRQVLAKKHPGSPHRSILVLDATTGQNALSQAKLFRDAAGVDELILTKIDGTAKGGIALAVSMQEKLPISFVGLGEKMEDLRPFNGDDFARAILGETEKAA